jgi:hypothetical protein
MPKLPTPATKAISAAAMICGRSTGMTIRPTMVAGPAPSICAASISECGMLRSPVQSVIATSGAWCRAITRMMPPRPSSGFGVPGAGESPSTDKTTEFGANRLRKASAATCGAIIIEKTKAKASGRLPRTSVTPSSSATIPPTSKAPSAEALAVSRVWSVALIAARLPISASAASGANASRARRPRRPAGRRAARRAEARQASPEPAGRDLPEDAGGGRLREQSPPASWIGRPASSYRPLPHGCRQAHSKIALKRLRAAVSSASALAASKGRSLIAVRAG